MVTTRGPRRYTVRFTEPGPAGTVEEYRVVTGRGELVAVSAAAMRHQRLGPVRRLGSVEVSAVEDEIDLDPANDLLLHDEVA